MFRRMGLIAGAFGLDAWSGLGNMDIHVEIDRVRQFARSSPR
jgi:hypothetical protein